MLNVVTIVAAVLIPFPLAQAAAPAAATNTVRLAPGAARPAARVADFAWLAGTWKGEGLGGVMEEVWSAPAGDAMVGHFRLVRNDKPSFYEIMTLVESESSVEMRLKHVNPDMTGWEEKADFVTFRLVRQDGAGAYFEGLTFKRPDADRIDGFLALRDRSTGVVREEQFVLRRVR